MSRAVDVAASDHDRVTPPGDPGDQEGAGIHVIGLGQTEVVALEPAVLDPVPVLVAQIDTIGVGPVMVVPHVPEGTTPDDQTIDKL